MLLNLQKYYSCSLVYLTPEWRIDFERKIMWCVAFQGRVKAPEKFQISSVFPLTWNIRDWMNKNQSHSLERKHPRLFFALRGCGFIRFDCLCWQHKQTPHNCHQIVIQILLISLHPLQSSERSAYKTTNTENLCLLWQKEERAHVGAHRSEKEADWSGVFWGVNSLQIDFKY